MYATKITNYLCTFAIVYDSQKNIADQCLLLNGTSVINFGASLEFN